MRRINAVGLKLLKASEGCRLAAYADPATGGEPWTIGWGSTGPDISRGLVWTQEQCDERLDAKLREIEAAIERLVHVPISDNAFSALCCFVYNVGIGAFTRSTLLKLVNQGDMAGAGRQFGLWTKANGRVMPGLVMRRTAEATLFRRPDA